MSRIIETGLIHATCVEVNGAGILMVGKSGVGKSSLALELMSRGGRLVGDDQVVLEPKKDGVTVRGAPKLQGQIEARGFGIISCPFVSATPLRLVVDLDQKESNRLPPRRKVLIAGLGFDLVYVGPTLSLMTASLMVLANGERLA